MRIDQLDVRELIERFEELEQDYSSVEYDDTTYWYRG